MLRESSMAEDDSRNSSASEVLGDDVYVQASSSDSSDRSDSSGPAPAYGSGSSSSPSADSRSSSRTSSSASVNGAGGSTAVPLRKVKSTSASSSDDSSETTTGSNLRSSFGTFCSRGRSNVALLLLTLGLAGLMLWGLNAFMVSMFRGGGESQVLAVTLGVFIVIIIGLAVPLGIFLGSILECFPCCEPTLGPTLLAFFGTLMLLNGAGWPLVFRGGDFGLYNSSTLFDADLDGLVAGGDGNALTANLGFVFRHAELGHRNGIVGAARGSVPCFWVVGRGTAEFTCNVVACVTPVWSPRSAATWNLQASAATRLVAAYATCFFPDSNELQDALLPDTCVQECGDQSNEIVGFAAEANTYYPADQNSLAPFKHGINWDWRQADPSKEPHGWRQFVGSAKDLSNFTLLAAAASALEQQHNVISLRDAHGDALLLQWGEFPIPYMQESGTIVVVCESVFGSLAVVIAAFGILWTWLF